MDKGANGLEEQKLDSFPEICSHFLDTEKIWNPRASLNKQEKPTYTCLRAMIITLLWLDRQLQLW